jgi:hypothetical protein
MAAQTDEQARILADSVHGIRPLSVGHGQSLVRSPIFGYIKGGPRFGVWLPSAGGFPPAFFVFGGFMRELSLFCDESGTEQGSSRYYVLSLVLHNQQTPLAEPFALYRQALTAKSLPNIPLHTSPLMNGHDAYAGMEMSQRKSLLMSFLTMYRHLPISYHTLLYTKAAFSTPTALAERLRRDLVDTMFDHLELFQSFDTVKVYYDDGQEIVTRALHQALDYALARETVLYRMASPSDYLLSQVADFICTVELTAQKYQDHFETPTDSKVFGTWRTFRENYLKPVRRKRLAR